MGQGESNLGNWFASSGMGALNFLGGIESIQSGNTDEIGKNFKEFGENVSRAWEGKGPISGDPLQNQLKSQLKEKLLDLGSKNVLNSPLWQEGTSAVSNINNQIRGVASHPAMNGTRVSNLAAISNPTVKSAIASSRGINRGIVGHSMNMLDQQSLNNGSNVNMPNSGVVNNSGGNQGPSNEMDAKQPQGGLQIN